MVESMLVMAMESGTSYIYLADTQTHTLLVEGRRKKKRRRREAKEGQKWKTKKERLGQDGRGMRWRRFVVSGRWMMADGCERTQMRVDSRGWSGSSGRRGWPEDAPLKVYGLLVSSCRC